jgi:hypothetical protein
MAPERRLTDNEILAQIPAARRRGAREAARAPRATSARYDEKSGRIVVTLSNGCLFEFPAELGEGLAGADPKDLAQIEVMPGGSGFRWEALDADLSVDGLVAGIFGSEIWMREMGRRGGIISSPAKTRAARQNGRKGGRPRKAERAR